MQNGSDKMRYIDLSDWIMLEMVCKYIKYCAWIDIVQCVPPLPFDLKVCCFV